MNSSWDESDGDFTIGSISIDFSPETILISPENNSVYVEGNISFNCSATDDNNLVNITLYGGWDGGWHADETVNLNGISDSAIFIKNLEGGIYLWNCLSYDNASQKDWGNLNWTININITSGNPPSYYNLTERPNISIYNPNQNYEFNITWIDDDGIGSVWIEFDHINYTSIYNLSNVYTFNINNLFLGTHNYTWYANDTSGNLNYTNQQNYPHLR